MNSQLEVLMARYIDEAVRLREDPQPARELLTLVAWDAVIAACGGNRDTAKTAYIVYLAQQEVA